MKLVACQACHTQYDVTDMAPKSHFDCRCGATLEATPPVATEATVHRCSSCGAIAPDQAETCDYCGAGIVRAVERGGLICPECYARNLDDARFCLGCGVAFDPQSPRATLSELRCPCCECWMTSREVAGLEIQECPKCHGLWAPEDRFETLVDRATQAAQTRGLENTAPPPRVDGANPAASQVEYRRCPTCDALMMRRNFRKRSGVIIDRCHQHGTWLDAHELERIAGFVLSGRAERAARVEAEFNASRDEKKVRESVLRVRGISTDSQAEYSIFGERKSTSTVGTIFDLLLGILN